MIARLIWRLLAGDGFGRRPWQWWTFFTNWTFCLFGYVHSLLLSTSLSDPTLVLPRQTRILPAGSGLSLG